MTASVWMNVLLAAFMASLLYVILKFFHRFSINNIQGLTVNYFTAALTSYLVNKNAGQSGPGDFMIPGFIIGLLFILVFYITALTTQKCGVAVTSIAGKMSMVIPIAMGILLFHDKLSTLKSIGIVIALIAVYLSTISSDKSDRRSHILFPVLLFIGSGMVDSSIKIAQHYFITEENFSFTIGYIFLSAGIAGLLIVSYQYLKKKVLFEFKSIVAGITLGIVNYFSLEFLIRCLAFPGIESSLVFALVNLLVVIFSALFAFTLFKEKPERANIAGLALALAAIIFLNYS